MTTELFNIEQLTQQSVQEVFQRMLSLEITVAPVEPPSNDGGGQIIGSVGFMGDEATGIIYLYASAAFAKVITSRMLGIEEAEVDTHEMVNDAMGELSNMVVGYVKSRLCDSGMPCVLTIPSVVRRQQLSVEGSSQLNRRMIGFTSAGHQLMVEVLMKEPQFNRV
jgi:chemotaxis protein CheX